MTLVLLYVQFLIVVLLHPLLIHSLQSILPTVPVVFTAPGSCCVHLQLPSVTYYSRKKQQSSCWWFFSSGDSNNNDSGSATSVTTTTTATTTTATNPIESYTTDLRDVCGSSTLYRTKQELLELAATFDRGFGASPMARIRANRLVQQLQQSNTAKNVADTILHDPIVHNNTNNNPDPSSYTLIGTWRLIWTTAYDVLSLQASPFFSVGAIHQVYQKNSTAAVPFSSPTETNRVINVIDFQPRIQSIFPPNTVPMSYIRAMVGTRAVLSIPKGSKKSTNNRVGLLFESIAIQPLQWLGINTTTWVPELTIALPQLPNSLQQNGYFDVLYLDETFLVLQQNAPGGIFALIRVNSIDL